MCIRDRIRDEWVASVLLFPDNEGEDKHVESKLIPRLDESCLLYTSRSESESE